MLKRITRAAWFQTGVARLLTAYLKFALHSTRWVLHGEEHLPPGAAVAAFWHECLPMMPALWMEARRRGVPGQAHVLVSRHRDGRLIGEIMRGFRTRLVHGSTASGGRDRGGGAGMRRLLGVLAAGDLVVMTPDGPRGPAHRAAPGVAQLAAVSGAPILPAAARSNRVIRLGSWDRMMLPLPFGRGVLVCGAPIAVARDEADAALPRIEAAISAVAEQAETLCPN